MAAVPYLTPDDVRGRRPQVADSDDAVIAQIIAEFEEVAEDYCGVAFTPRDATATVDGMTVSWLTPISAVPLTFLRPMIRSITTATMGAATVDPPTIIDARAGTVAASGWSGIATVTYSHGFDAPPALLLRACAMYVDSTIASDRSGTSRDVLSQSFDGGTTRYSTPSKKDGRPTGYSEVDRLLNECPMFARSGVH